MFEYSYPFMNQSPWSWTGQQRRPQGGLFNGNALSDWGSQPMNIGLLGPQPYQQLPQPYPAQTAGPFSAAPAPSNGILNTQPQGGYGPTPYAPPMQPSMPNNGFGPYPTNAPSPSAYPNPAAAPSMNPVSRPGSSQSVANPYQAPANGAMTSAGQWGGGQSNAPTLPAWTASMYGYGTAPQGATGFNLATGQWVF